MSRVLIGPANYAGQAEAWAAALRAHGRDAGSFAFRPKPRLWPRKSPGFGFPAGQRLPFPKLTTPAGRRRRTQRLAQSATHLLLDGFLTLLGPAGSGLSQPELDRIAAWGPRLGLVAHGSDVRDPEKHTRENPDSYFPLLEPAFRAWLAERSAANRDLAAGCGLPVFVSTPDLLLDLPGATWLPLAVDVERWTAPDRPPNHRPRVLHVPSSRMRGSESIDPVLADLDGRGLIQYVRLSGVAHDHMPGLVASADVVIDQVRSGFYGVTAVEAMLSGAVVVGHVSPAVRALLPGDPGIVEARPATFAATMTRLLDTRDEWAARVSQAREHARTWHDGTESARVLSAFVSDRA